MATVDERLDGTASAPIVLHDLEIHLRTRADQAIRHALQIGTLRMAGYRAGEIRERLMLTPGEYRQAAEWLKDALAQIRRDE